MGDADKGRCVVCSLGQLVHGLGGGMAVVCGMWYKERFAQLLADPHKMPTALNIANSIKHIEKIIKAQVPSLDTIEWKDGCLYILDPFLLFYLRWGGVWQR